MADCFCFRKYVCLACERKANGEAVVRISNRPQASCGTRAGYNRHLKMKEETCADCKAAQLEAVQEWKRRKIERESA